VLLQPLVFEIATRPDIEEKIAEINALWFDANLLSQNKLVIYAVPQIFSMYKVDIDVLFTHIFSLEHITFDHVLDTIFASKACKTSIKAWDRLSYEQMSALIKDWFTEIDGMFVCQHGRPFFVQIEKGNIDKFFDR
jgi:DNA mismatch repair ATPase MutL